MKTASSTSNATNSFSQSTQYRCLWWAAVFVMDLLAITTHRWHTYTYSMPPKLDIVGCTASSFTRVPNFSLSIKMHGWADYPFEIELSHFSAWWDWNSFEIILEEEFRPIPLFSACSCRYWTCLVSWNQRSKLPHRKKRSRVLPQCGVVGFTPIELYRWHGSML